MGAKKTLVKGKKGTLGRLMDIAKKGNELWYEYGDVVKRSVASIINKDRDDTLGISSEAKKYHEEQHDAEEVVDTTQREVIIESPGSEKPKEDTFFEDQQSRLYSIVIKDTIIGGQLSNPQQCLAALNEIYSVADETIRYCEEQETKRETIRAERDVAIAKIKEMGELVKAYLEKTYDERLAIFTKQFDAIDVAISSGNVEMLAGTLNSMNALASSSPFKNLADISSVQQGLIDQNEWDI